MGADASSFYVPLGEGLFRATELTASPWGPGSQHGGPPAALLGRTLESDAGGEDTSAWTFVNPETTVHLHAYPGGEWVGLESSAAVQPSGVGLARTTIHDPVIGPVGAAAQSLLVVER